MLGFSKIVKFNKSYNNWIYINEILLWTLQTTKVTTNLALEDSNFTNFSLENPNSI